MIRICSYRYPAPKDAVVINTTSRSTDFGKGLSPFFLGPVMLYGDYQSRNVENAWQYSKVYKAHTDKEGNPTEAYFEWAVEGWGSSRASRYPMGQGTIPLYSYWDGDKLDYIEARKRIYCPLYAKALENNIPLLERLSELYADLESKGEDLYLWDFDGYDKFDKTYEQVLNDPSRKMGHAFVVAMMLEDKRVWEKN